MTRIVEITGIRRPLASDAAEAKQRAAQVKPAAFVDTSSLSEGEMRLFLLAQRAKMRAEYYPDFPAYRQEFMRVRDTLHKGLHRGAGLSHLRERLQTAPASKLLPWISRQRKPSAGIRNLFDDAPPVAAAVGVVPQLDCNALYPPVDFSNAANLPAPVLAQMQALNQQRITLRQACQLENQWRTWLNTYWAAQSHTLLYRFMSTAEQNTVPNRAAIKADKHFAFFSGIQKASTISDANLLLWLENGTIYNNIQGAPGKNGIGDLSAQETIQALKEGAAINGFPPAMLAIIVPLAIAIVKHTFNQAKLAKGVIDRDLTLKQAVDRHIQSLSSIWQQYGDDIVNFAASNKDFAAGVTTDPGSGGPGSGDPGPGVDTGTTTGNKNLFLLGGAALIVLGLTRK